MRLIFCKIFHRRWILWEHGKGFYCGKCNNSWNWKNYQHIPKQMDKNWQHHLKEVGRLW